MNVKRRFLFMGERPLGAYIVHKLLHNPAIELLPVVTSNPNKTVWWSTPRVAEICMQYGHEWIDVEDSSSVEQLVEKFERPWIILCGLHTKILPPCLLNWPISKSLNFHNAPLPKYKGFNCTYHAILNGERNFATVLHELSEEVDAGPIVDSIRFEIPQGCSNRQLYELGVIYSKKLFDRNTDRVTIGSLPISVPIKQGGKFYRRNSITRSVIDGRQISEDDIRQIRALDFPPFEPAKVEFKPYQFFARVTYDNYKNRKLSAKDLHKTVYPVSSPKPFRKIDPKTQPKKIDTIVQTFHPPFYKPAFLEVHNVKIYLTKNY